MTEPIEITEPVLLIRIAQSYYSGMPPEELYEATRGVWKIGSRRENAQYTFTVVKGIVQEVYAIHSWHQAGSTPYSTRSKGDVTYPDRWEFLGEVAPREVCLKYVGYSLAHYFKRGEVSPVKYINC